MAEGHNFGGDWTDDKLGRIRRYLESFTTALKRQNFSRLYVDAFAGTGYRTQSNQFEIEQDQLSFIDPPGMEAMKNGSARIALGVESGFHRYVFIEKHAARFEQLQKLRTEFPNLSDKLEILRDDANTAIVAVCRETDWQKWRAVVFLDPYGAQVDWRTIEAIANTKAIDLWYLFPSIALDRMLPKNGVIPESWQDRLDQMLGDVAWRTEFYAESGQTDLFSIDNRKERKASVDAIDRYMGARLGSVFPAVAKRSARMCNSTGYCMYLLYFACANPNPKAHRLALRIAEHILKD